MAKNVTPAVPVTATAQAVVALAASKELVECRKAVATATESAYGAMRKYAVALCSVLPAQWYKVEHSDTSDEAKRVHAEKKELFAELKAVKHSNPSTIWARVRKYAQEHAEPHATGTDAGGSEGEGDSVGRRETRSIKLRFIEELGALYKAGKREDSMADDVSKAHTYVAAALAALGVDVGSLVK